MRWVVALLGWLLGRLQRRQAEQAADAAAITRNKEAVHAAQSVESRPVLPVPVVARRMRDGSF